MLSGAVTGPGTADISTDAEACTVRRHAHAEKKHMAVGPLTRAVVIGTHAQTVLVSTCYVMQGISFLVMTQECLRVHAILSERCMLARGCRASDWRSVESVHVTRLKAKRMVCRHQGSFSVEQLTCALACIPGCVASLSE